MNNKNTLAFSLAIFYSIFTTISFPQAGQLDTTFGQNGIVTIAGESFAYSVAIQSDGKIVAAGYSDNGSDLDFAIIRYNSDGALDNTFGTNGIVITSVGASGDYATSIAIQSDGKIIAAGNSYNGSDNDFAVVRYNSNGSLDNTFGTNGIVITSVGDSSDYANSIAIQSDGKIIAAGNSFNGSDDDFAVVRYNSNGALDNTFGTNGIVITSVGDSSDYARSIAIQSDSKIIAAGYSYNGSDFDLALVRYNSNGSLDNTFGTNGIVITSVGDSSDYARSIAIQSDSKIIAAGYSYNGSDYDFALVRYNSNGALDNTFGTNGVVTTDVGAAEYYANSIEIQSDGKIIAAGNSFNGSNFDIALVRYNSNGSLDNTFGTNGVVTTDVGTEGDYATSIAIQSDEKIIVAGGSIYMARFSFLRIVRYLNNASTGVDEKDNGEIPTAFALEQNYPNPFNPTTAIKYSIPVLETHLPAGRQGRDASVQLRIYDILGREVATLVNETKAPGNYEVNFNASNLASGVYFYQLKAGEFILTKKMILLK